MRPSQLITQTKEVKRQQMLSVVQPVYIMVNVLSEIILVGCIAVSGRKS